MGYTLEDYNNYTTFENVETPRVYQYTNSLGDSIEIPDVIGVTENGTPLIQNNIQQKSNSPKMVIDNNPEMEPSVVLQNPETQYVSPTPSNTKSQYKFSNKDQKSTALYIMNYLINQKGIRAHEAAGIVGNLMAESSLNPSSFNGNDLGLPAGGIAGFRGSNFSRLKAFSGSRGKSWKDLDSQIEFLHSLLSENNPQMNGVRDRLAASKNPHEASEAWAYYERYAGYDGTTKTARKAGWSQDRINKEHKKRSDYSNEVYNLWKSQKS